MHPDQNLNAYLTLVERLNNKIDQIKFSIGTDQSVLGEEANPKEFIDIYSPDTDGQVMDQNDDDDELLGEDEFVRDLREFHSTATDFEKDFVSQIGSGKWGYLPSGYEQYIQDVVALALVRVEGKFKHNGENFRSHLFVRKIDQYAPVESYAALSALRVDKSKTERRADMISLDRDEIRRKVVQLAKINSTRQPSYYKRTPKVNEAIAIFANYKAVGMDFDLALDKVQTKQTLKRAKYLVKLINKEHANQGTLSQPTIKVVESFINQMNKLETVGVIPGEIEGVLYFAN
jgi:hypothetical protein